MPTAITVPTALAHHESPPSPAARALTTRVFHRWLLPAVGDWLVIGALFAAGLAAESLLAWAAIVVLIGNRQHALGVLGHDAAHYAAAENRRLNDLAAELLCFWPLITGLHDFRQFHLEHHRYFGTERDPELRFKDRWSTRQWQVPTSRARIIAYFLGDLMGLGIIEVVKAYWLLGKTRPRSWIGPLAWWAVAGAILYATNLGVVAVVWFLALITSFWGFFRLRTWTEHIATESTHRVRANWWQQHVITPHGSWSHYEHHDAPSVPFWRRHELRPTDAATVGIGELFASFAHVDAGITSAPGETGQQSR